MEDTEKKLMEKQEVLLGQKNCHSGHLHGLINKGGTIKFKDIPFGIRFRCVGGAFVNVEFFSIPLGRIYQGHTVVTIKKKPKTTPEEDFELEKAETIEM